MEKHKFYQNINHRFYKLKKFKLIGLSLILCCLFSCKTNDDANWSLAKSSENYLKIEKFIINNPDTKHLVNAIDLVVRLKNQSDTLYKFPTIYPNYYGRNALRIIIREDNIEIISERFDGNANNVLVQQLIEVFLKNDSIEEDLPQVLYKKNQTCNYDLRITKAYVFIVIDLQANIDVIRQILAISSKALDNYKSDLKEELSKRCNQMNRDEINMFIDSILNERIQIFSIDQHNRTLLKPNDKQ